MALQQYITSFISIFFPEACIGCKKALLEEERFICMHCEYGLPQTQFHLDAENKAMQSLAGRVPLVSVASYFYFTSGSIAQQIMHAIKYQGRQKAAHYLGTKYGEVLKRHSFFQDVIMIIPVPLHPKKKRQRGYNQSEYFGKGLSESMGIELQTSFLVRIKEGESQTKKSRYERYENTKSLFQVQNGQHLVNQHVLLVDDVFTTGATIEACANVLLSIKGVKVSVLTLAYTK